MTNWPTGINHLPEKSLLLTTTSENKPRSWQPRRNITSLIDRKCFHRSFVSLTSGLNKINHSTAWNLNREGSKFSNTVKRSRPYFVLSCFNPSKFMVLEGSNASTVNKILLGNRKSIAATILKWFLWQQRGFNMAQKQ